MQGPGYPRCQALPSLKRAPGDDGAGPDGAGPGQERSSQEAVACGAGPVSSLDGVVIGLWSLDPKYPKV